MDLLQTNLRRALIGDEGRSQYVYKDSRGFYTIAIGRLADSRIPGSGLSQDEEDYLFSNDVTRIYKLLNEFFPWAATLDDARKGALLNMLFEMGAEGVLGFTNSLRLARANRWQEMAQELKRSDWAKQVPARAARISEQWRTGNWQFA